MGSRSRSIKAKALQAKFEWARWGQEAWIFCEPGGLLANVNYLCDELGCVRTKEAIRHSWVLPWAPPTEQDFRAMLETALGLALPLLLTVSFMHCKNVYLDPRTPDPGLAKAYEKRYGRPVHQHHVLRIEPKAVRRPVGAEPMTKRRLPLHLVRGHFEDHREQGLFGRKDLKGIYWWDAHVRGDEAYGTVRKQYDVHPPKFTRVGQQAEARSTRPPRKAKTWKKNGRR